MERLEKECAALHQAAHDAKEEPLPLGACFPFPTPLSLMQYLQTLLFRTPPPTPNLVTNSLYHERTRVGEPTSLPYLPYPTLPTSLPWDDVRCASRSCI